MMSANRMMAALVVVAALSGCAGGFSGLGGSSDYACTAPEGVSCMSVTGLNANVTNRTLPAMQPRSEQPPGRKSDEGKGAEVKVTTAQAYASDGLAAGRVSPSSMDAPFSGQPIRTPPRVLRVWMAPFEDTDSDLHDQKYLYVTVHTGRWVLEANQVNVQRQFKQVYPLGKGDVDTVKSAPANATARDQGAIGPRVGQEQRVQQTSEVD